MRQMTKKLMAALIMVFVVALMFTVVGSAATEGESAKENGKFSVDAAVERAKTELADAPYIGEYCQKAFDYVAEHKTIFVYVYGLLACVICFFGYRLLRLATFLLGLVGGFVGGLMLTPYVEKIFDSLPAFMPLVIGGVCGLVAAILLNWLFKYVLVIGAGVGGFALAATYLEGMQYFWVYSFLIALACMVVAYFLLRVFFVLVTAIVGGVVGVVTLLKSVEFAQKVLYKNDAVFKYTEVIGVNSLTVAVAIGLVVALIGIIVQFMNTRKKRI